MPRTGRIAGCRPGIALALAAPVATGCPRPWRPAPEDVPGREAVPDAVFQEGQEAYLARNYARAASRLGAYAGAHEGTADGVRAKYWQAMSLLGLGQARRARLLLEEVQATPLADRALRALALRGVARTHVAERNYAAAELAYRRLRSVYPRESSEEEILAALAACRQHAGDAAGATRYRRQLAERYPDSAYLAGTAQAGGVGEAPGASAGRHVVQAGVFQSRVFASRLAERIRRAGFESIVAARAGAYIVQAGSFSDSQGAERRAAALRAAGFNAIVKP